jgi:hypothetical protein
MTDCLSQLLSSAIGLTQRALLLVLAFIAVVKIVHFAWQTLWLLTHGAALARVVDEALEQKEPDFQKVATSVADMRRETHTIVFPLLDLAARLGGLPGHVLYALGQALYRLPSLIVFLSILGYFSRERWQIILAGTVVVVAVVAQTAYVITTWLALGRASAFYYHSVRLKTADEYLREIQRWRRRDRLNEFLLGFIIIFFSFIFGLGFVHFATEATFDKCDYYITGTKDSAPRPGCALPLLASDVIGDAITFTYFSLVVISTTGFGDIYPISLPARAVTGFEIALNVLFVVVLLFSVSMILSDTIPRARDKTLT